MSPDAWEKLADRAFDAFLLVIGAVIAAAVQAFFSHEQRRDERLTRAYSIFHKIQTYGNSIVQICEFVLRTNKQAIERKRPLWKQMGGLRQGHMETANFTPDELAIFSATGHQKIADNLIEYANLHNFLTTMMDTFFNEKRLFEQFIEDTGALHAENTDEIEEAFVARYPLKAGHLEQMAGYLLEYAESGVKRSTDITQNISSDLRNALRDKRFRPVLARTAVSSGSHQATSTD